MPDISGRLFGRFVLIPPEHRFLLRSFFWSLFPDLGWLGLN